MTGLLIAVGGVILLFVLRSSVKNIARSSQVTLTEFALAVLAASLCMLVILVGLLVAAAQLLS